MRRCCVVMLGVGALATCSVRDAAAQPANGAAPAAPSGSPWTPNSSYDWTGLYFGGHVGYGRGTTNGTYFTPPPTSADHGFGTMLGGVQVGYGTLLSSRILLGIEADMSFPNFLETDDIVIDRPTPIGTAFERLDYVSTLRGRVGHAFNHWLLYVTGGFAWSQARFTEEPGLNADRDKVLRLRAGWTVGAGAEWALTSQWSWRAEYLYDRFDHAGALMPSGTRIESSMTDLHFFRLGLNYHFGRRAPDAPIETSIASAIAGSDAWNVHGQMTVIGQGYGPFHAPYSGAASLYPFGQFKHTATATGYLGLRVWEGGEVYVNPELMQGFGLSDVTGVAGFPNGEAQKSDFPIPRLNIARVFLRQTFGLGGEQETLEDGPNQLAKKVDVSRITVTAGKFATLDLFNGNSYANDPRTTFLNWNMYGGGSYDWTMDKLSWTWGGAAELNQKAWAVRGGYFMLPEVANSNFFDSRFPEHGHFVGELELRYAVAEQPGKLRLMGWWQEANSGSYAESLALSPSSPDLAQTRRSRVNYGVVANIEQAITQDLGLFSRASWNPGQVEMMGWTDVHRSLSLGAQLKGTSWGRPDDKIGVGGVIEALSSAGRSYFAAGGIGILIGDGALNYREEKILEAYYSYALNRWSWITFDYQYIANPAYNADRGPVSIYAGRFHTEF